MTAINHIYIIIIIEGRCFGEPYPLARWSGIEFDPSFPFLCKALLLRSLLR